MSGSRIAPRSLGLVAVGLLVGTLPGGCRDSERRPTTPEHAPSAPRTPSLRIVALTDLDGYLEPCGCQSRPLGGIDKAAAELARLDADAVPRVFVSAGDLFFASAGPGSPHEDPGAADASTQQRLRAETLAAVLSKLELDAAAPGAGDLSQGAPQLAALAERAGVTLLAAGAELTARSGQPRRGAPGAEQGALAAEPSAAAPGSDTDSPPEPAEQPLDFGATQIVQRGGLKLGIFGLSDFADAPEVRAPRDLPAEAKRLSAQLREQGAQVVLGLLRSDARTARRVAGASRELDFLVHGGPDLPQATPPERIGNTTLLHASHRGQGLLVLDLYTDEAARGAGFADASDWTRQAKRDALGAEIDSLAKRIAAWETQPGVDPAQLATQRGRLSAMRAELSSLEQPAALEPNAFVARFLELGPEIEGEPAVRALLAAHDARVNEHNRRAFADLAPLPVPDGAAGYVGSEPCQSCHAAAYAWWQGHPHGHAYATLERRNKQFHLDCVGCHVTGYNKPGGAAVVQNEGLTNVGCESCHGPGSAHVADPEGVDAARDVSAEVPEAVCKQCHVPEHSDRFEYRSYRAMLMAPGHGLPPAGAP